jgi:hypothetical protein
MVDNIHKTTDAIKEYHRKINWSPTRNQHDFKHGDDSTEPKISLDLKLFSKLFGNAIVISIDVYVA